MCHGQVARAVAALLASALLTGPTASAAFLIVPPDLGNTQGGLGGTTPFAFPTTNGVRSQLVYDASLFAGVSGPQLITAIQFRPIDPAGGIFGTTLTVADVRLQLSTTGRSDENRNPLSTTFADNVGADARTVYTGPLTLTTTSAQLPNGTRAFDYIITLQTGFVYDPAAGNLLLDTLVPVGAAVGGNGFFGAFPRFDTTGRANDGIYAVINNPSSGSATTGILSTSGPVTRFELTPVAAVPVPPSLVLGLAGAGPCLLAAVWRRGRRAAT